ncbi:hypothetical protein ACH4VR_36285 [Streptomyces sp. NPDC020883]|uniref:hypothetical protein n=1 Tax=Streptomyces sp. NPDC020883 TaxID=3365099 RepID=UPI00379D872C
MDQAASVLAALRVERVQAGLLQAAILLLETHASSCNDEKLLATTETALVKMREVIGPLPEPRSAGRSRQSTGSLLEPG